MDIEKKLMPDEKIFIRSEVTKKPFVIKMIELGITELLLLGVLFLVLVNIGSVNDDNIAIFIVLLSVFGDYNRNNSDDDQKIRSYCNKYESNCCT